MTNTGEGNIFNLEPGNIRAPRGRLLFVLFTCFVLVLVFRFGLGSFRRHSLKVPGISRKI